jgi:hypothetical protein
MPPTESEAMPAFVEERPELVDIVMFWIGLDWIWGMR